MHAIEPGRTRDRSAGRAAPARGRAAGSDAALEALYQRYSADVHRLAWRITQSEADAEDVLQDVFVSLRQTLASYAARGSFQGWLRRVTVRVALDRLRSQRRRREVVLEQARAKEGSGPAAERAELRRLLATAIGRLPEPLRLVFVLREIEGYSHAEIGELLGLPPNASEVRLHRAKKLLRDYLDNPRSRGDA